MNNKKEIKAAAEAEADRRFPETVFSPENEELADTFVAGAEWAAAFMSKQPKVVPDTVLPLTIAELEVFQLAGLGHTTKWIADKRTASPRTVECQLKAIYEKTGVTNRDELISLFLDSPVQGETVETLGDIAEVLREWKSSGTTRQAVEYALGRVFYEEQAEPNDDREALAKNRTPIDHEPRFNLGECSCGAKLGDSIDWTWHISNESFKAGRSARDVVPDAATTAIERDNDLLCAALGRVRVVVKGWSPADSYARDEILMALDGALDEERG